MRVLTLLFVLLIAGCSTTVPVKQKFPEAPETLLKKCPELVKLGDSPKLSDVAKTIALNYTSYYECAVKNDAWVEWYQNQKRIYESVE